MDKKGYSISDCINYKVIRYVGTGIVLSSIWIGYIANYLNNKSFDVYTIESNLTENSILFASDLYSKNGWVISTCNRDIDLDGKYESIVKIENVIQEKSLEAVLYVNGDVVTLKTVSKLDK